jgi:hypothetical protein
MAARVKPSSHFRVELEVQTSKFNSKKGGEGKTEPNLDWIELRRKASRFDAKGWHG